MKLTVFADRTASRLDVHDVDWPTIVANFSDPPEVDDKAQCTLFSLCEFGDKLTERGSYRSNDNVKAIGGVCGDYDGEVIQPEAAALALQAANIEALVYTSPSHTAEAPRWRVVCPVHGAGIEPQRHSELVERLNTIVGGGLSSESFTLSQPYYVGKVRGHPYWAQATTGRTIDQASDIARTPWRGAQGSDGHYNVPTDALVADIEAGVEIHPAIVALAARGYTRDELEDIVTRSATKWERPERAQVAIDSDIPRAVESWQRKQAAELQRKLAAMTIPPQPEQPRSSDYELIIPIGALMHNPSPMRWQIRDIFERANNCVMFGESNVGKSFVAIDMACSIAHGLPWRGHKTKQGRVLFICGEGFRAIRRRFKAWHMHNGIDPSKWNSAPISVTRRAINMLDLQDQLALVAEIEKFGDPALVVVDTYARMTPGLNDNAAQDAGRYIQCVDDIIARFDSTVITIAHSGKTDKETVRGSGALKAAVDVEMLVSWEKKAEGIIKLGSTKMKDNEAFKPHYFKFQTFTLPELENPDEPDETPRQQKTAILLDCDKPETDVGGRPDEGSRMIFEIVRDGEIMVDQARDAFKRVHGGESKTAARAFNRAVKRMIEGGRIIHDEQKDTLRLVLGQGDKT